MFNFLKSLLNEEEQKIFDVTIKPYIGYSLFNTVLIILASNNIGNFNEDTIGGLFISWLIYTFIMLAYLK